ncbi:type II CRISPR RNA-guided endonuclease Cas9 [Gracilibacillus thailandensis]|uniref:CRISPR-associated endonuclease Cas9 n=1 Tax=Gracilibacillus thailandensis TaxID=563735 RepID=A0A6N7QXE6_9BACI|nr:type II CRISPR RNA-guided endonuclease Cas9 [Gracilibacillus thailandensis]MRI65832.1 type II CRISPR RNA-guided endonuclease Cas9 [Gracilibacillus thailandensis]
MNRPYVLGLDIGIGSVGWGIIDQNQNIIDAGVRLFPEADKTFNESRRSYRGTRRLLRRRRHRIERVYQLLDNHRLWRKEDRIDYRNHKETPYHIRVKGLTEPLSNEELAIALIHLAKRRGIHNLDVAEDDKTSKNELSTYEQIKRNKKLLDNKYICEIQMERLEKEGQIRGHRNRFQTADYVKEAKKILETQKSFNKQVTGKLIESYIDLLENRREYYDGPGYGSEYGWDQDIKKWYENMMGKCSYFPDELRAVKESHSAQLFNLLNDLNNLILNREENTKLTKEEKELLIENQFKQYKSVTLKRIAKELKVDEHDIKGFRIDTKGKALLTSLSTYHDIKKITSKPNILESIDTLDKIAELATIFQSKNDVKQELVRIGFPLNEEEIEQISDLNYSGTHSLSLKMINQLLPDLWETSKNQIQLITERGYKPKDVNYENKTYIPYSQIDEYILSPVVKRSFKQTVRIINAVIKKYGVPSEIVVELAREKNSDDKKKFLNDLNKRNATIIQQVREKLDAMDLSPSKGLFNMLRLWHLQDGLCMYSIEPIPIEDLMNNPQHYEIDHIIPRSVSFDDSQNNKVLVRKEENQQKGNLTPFQYFRSNKTSVTYEKFKANVLQLAKSSQKVSRKKKEYLLEERDINKFSVQKDFINRNLVDTRYATREILNTLQQFFVANNQNVKIKSINGSFTNYLRKLWDFNKDRGADFKHHAEDALIVAMANHIFEYKKSFKADHLVYANDNMLDAETGEVLSEDQFNAAFTEKINKIKAIKNYKGYKYSHKVDMKPNRQLMNDTLFSTRVKDDQEYVINKIKDIYDADNDKLKKIMNKNPEDLLMYQHDKQTYEKLERIFEQYSEVKNPLQQFYKETGEYLTKYSKKGNGPVVKSIKYYGIKLSEYHDLSDKFNPKNKKVITLSIKPLRMDVYFENGLYKFITIRYNDLKENKNGYNINREIYEQKLKEKKINSKENFVFSLYKNDIMEINGEELRLIGVNNDKLNRIEVNTVNYEYKEYCEKHNIKNKRLIKTISRNTTHFVKLATDVLGNKYIINNEKLKFSFYK